MNTKAIVVGVDGSRNMPAVLAASATLARRLGAEIVLVTAATAGEDAEGIQATAAMQLDGVVERVVARGHAWRVICDVAKNRDASAVVIGAHNYVALERALGTTAAHVVDHAEAPVLVVRGALSFDRMLVAHDGSKRAPGVLSSALRLLAEAEGRLVLVRAIEPIFRDPFGPKIDVRQIEQLLAEDVAASVPSGRTELKAYFGEAQEVVLTAAKAADATLIVIGSHGYGSIDRLLGTTAARIVNHADRCVLVVKGNALEAHVSPVSVGART